MLHKMQSINTSIQSTRACPNRREIYVSKITDV